MIFFLDSETPMTGPHNPALTWGKVVTGGLEVHVVPGNGKHGDIFKEPYVQALAEQVRSCLEEALST